MLLFELHQDHYYAVILLFKNAKLILVVKLKVIRSYC